MLGVGMYTTIKTLWKQGANKSQIARVTGHDWKTVAKVIRKLQAGIEYPQKKKHPRILDRYKEEIIEWREEGLTGLRIYEKIQGKGINISYSTVKDYLSKIKKRDDIFIRLHTKPGEEAQVDFGYLGVTRDNQGKKRKTWIFNMRLSYSRLDYYEKVYDQRVETFIRCHMNAFDSFGGIPGRIKIDNLKAAILKANFYEPVYQKIYKDFANYYGFRPLPCRIYRPNDKGKVESGIKYVKNNFFAGRKFKDGEDLDRQLKNWQQSKCNQRVHGTTRKIPQQLFEDKEKKELSPLPIEEFKLVKAGSRKVYHDCHIYVDYNYYSVPFEYVGKYVDIELTQKLLKVYYKNRLVTIHPRQSNRGNFSTKANHYPRYKRYSRTEYQERYQVKMAQIGRFAEQIFFLIIENQSTDWMRTIAGILSLRKQYPIQIIDAACKRALSFGVHQYQIIKNICANGSYNLPTEFKEGIYEHIKK